MKYLDTYRPGTAAGGSLKDQNKGPQRDQRAADKRLCRDRLVQKDKGHDDAEDDAELVRRNHLRGLADLQCAEVKEPRRSRGQPGQNEKEPALAADVADLAAAPGHKDDEPGHYHDHHGAHRRREIGIHAFDTDLRKDRSKRREERRT